MQSAHLYNSTCLNHPLEGLFSSFATVNTETNFRDEWPVMWKLPRAEVGLTKLEHYNLEYSIEEEVWMTCKSSHKSCRKCDLISG